MYFLPFLSLTLDFDFLFTRDLTLLAVFYLSWERVNVIFWFSNSLRTDWSLCCLKILLSFNKKRRFLSNSWCILRLFSSMINNTKKYHCISPKCNFVVNTLVRNKLFTDFIDIVEMLSCIISASDNCGTSTALV